MCPVLRGTLSAAPASSMSAVTADIVPARPGNGTPGEPADRAVPTVAGHQVAGPQPALAVRAGDGRLDRGVVLAEIGQHGAPAHGGAQLAQPLLEHLLQPVLRDQQPVRVPGAPRAGVQRHR